MVLDGWRLCVRFGPDLLRDGRDPLPLVRRLAALGGVVQLTAHFGERPEEERFDPQECRLRLELHLDDRADRFTLEEVYGLVGEDGRIRLVPPGAGAADGVQLLRELPGGDLGPVELLVVGGGLTLGELDAFLERRRR
jgi:two-component system chemotaxis sensor kinase CheA